MGQSSALAGTFVLLIGKGLLCSLYPRNHRHRCREHISGRGLGLYHPKFGVSAMQMVKSGVNIASLEILGIAR